MRVAHIRKRAIGGAMSKRSCCFVGVIVTSTLTVCLLAFYDDIQDTFLRSYADYAWGDWSSFTRDVPSTVSQRSARASAYHGSGIKTVLLWNTLFGDRNFYFGEGNAVFRDCPVDRCKIFNYRDYLNVEDYDAILFHGNELSGYGMPARRRPQQLYVYVNLESPANRAIPCEYDEDYFNLTMTYRLDSDVPWTYSIIEEIKTGKFVAPSRNADWSALRNGTRTYAPFVGSSPLAMILQTNQNANQPC